MFHNRFNYPSAIPGPFSMQPNAKRFLLFACKENCLIEVGAHVVWIVFPSNCLSAELESFERLFCPLMVSVNSTFS
jgi:hypothetical protein